MDARLKTQIRFEMDDICLYTKVKGSDDPFSPADMENIKKAIDLPDIDASINWVRKPDRPAWRQVSPKTGGRVVLKSLNTQGRTTAAAKSKNNENPSNRKRPLSADSSDSDSSKELNKSGSKNDVDMSESL